MAGLTIANEFVGSGRRVLVLESGPAQGNDEATERLRDGENVGLPYFAVRDLTRRGLGGNSTRWSSFAVPFDSIDFEAREWVPYSGWPLRRDQLQSHYERASVICGVGEYSYDAAVVGRRVAERGYESIDEPGGLCSTRMFQFRDPPLNWGEAYRDRLEEDPDIDICVFANALSIESDSHDRSVDRIVFGTVNGKRFYVTAKKFVLAMGGIEIPRVMLASKNGRRYAVGNQHDLVGRFFMEHPHYTGIATLAQASSGSEYPAMYTWEAIRRHKVVGMIGPTADTQHAHRILNCATMLQNRSEPWAGAVKAEGFLGHLSEVMNDTASLVARTVRSPRIGGRIGARTYRRPLLGFRIQYEQAPNPESRVTLSDEVDPLELPRVRLNWQMTELDRRSFEIGHEVIARELSRIGLGRVRMVAFDDKTLWPPPYTAGQGPSLFGAWHYMGTTRMSNDPKMGVVDADCRVHDMANLFIAGPSLFPTSSFANPVLTAVALALRLADYLKKQ